MCNPDKEIKNYYLQQFELFDGECDITFNILDVDTDKMIIKLAVSNRGKISVLDFDLKRDREQNLYFEYGVDLTNIKIDDFETTKEN